MSKSHTEIALTGGDLALTLGFENKSVHPMDYNIEVAKVGDITVTLDPAAIARKQDALETASLISEVKNEEERTLAVQTIGTLKAYTNGIEKSRKEVKQPFWDAGQAIDKIAKDESKPVLEEINRVEGLLTGYQRELDRQAAERERARQEEERKRVAAEQAKLAEEQRLRAEADRKAREALAAAANAKSNAARREAEIARLEAELAQRKADDLARERRDAENAAQFAPAIPQPEIPGKAEGTNVRQDWDISVTDWDALYRAHGLRFIRCELDRAAVKYHLNTPGVKPDSIPGINAQLVTNVKVRAAK